MVNLRTMTGVEVSDADLVARSVAGDREAFSQIVARYQTLVCSLAYSGMGNLGQSEDVAQETFIAAWRHLRRLREPDKLRAWLCGIVRNRVRKSLRREGREPARLAMPLDAAPDTASREAMPSEQTISREEEAILWRSLERIPETYREPLILFYREHQSIERVAVALGLSEDAVRQRLSRGRKLLHEEVVAFVEGTLSRSAPGQAFSAAVLAALPLGSVTAAGAGAGMAGKGTMAAKSGGLLGWLTAWLAPVLGLVGGLTAHWIIIRAAPTRRERRLKIVAFTTLWGFVLGWLFVVQPGLRSLSRHLQWTDRTFFAMMAGFWWLYAAVLASLSVVVFRRVFVIRRQTAAAHPAGTVAPAGSARHVLLVIGVYLACFSWMIGLAWQAGDRPSAGILFAIMLALGAWNYCQVHGRNGVGAARAVVGHMALIWAVILAMLNWRLADWLASLRGVDLGTLHRLLPAPTVPLLTLGLLVWVGLLLALTRPDGQHLTAPPPATGRSPA
jgi:RNA polymerase sigma factor (sigma-70 family)